MEAAGRIGWMGRQTVRELLLPSDLYLFLSFIYIVINLHVILNCSTLNYENIGCSSNFRAVRDQLDCYVTFLSRKERKVL